MGGTIAQWQTARGGSGESGQALGRSGSNPSGYMAEWCAAGRKPGYGSECLCQQNCTGISGNSSAVGRHHPKQRDPGEAVGKGGGSLDPSRRDGGPRLDRRECAAYGDQATIIKSWSLIIRGAGDHFGSADYGAVHNAWCVRKNDEFPRGACDVGAVPRILRGSNSGEGCRKFLQSWCF